MTNKHGAGFLVSAYFVLGIALVPMLAPSTPPVFQNVLWSECHWGCQPGHKPCVRVYLCRVEGSPRKATEAYKPTTGPTGSTGPNRPPPPKTGGSHQ
jgi:hypothetical protein